MAKSVAQDRDRVNGVGAATRESELTAGPIDGGVVALKPVEAENDRIPNRNDA